MNNEQQEVHVIEAETSTEVQPDTLNVLQGDGSEPVDQTTIVNHDGEEVEQDEDSVADGDDTLSKPSDPVAGQAKESPQLPKVVQASDEEFTAIASVTLETILPVQFSDEAAEKKYVSTLFPPRKAPKGIAASREHYPELYDYLGSVSTLANLVLQQARYVYIALPGYIAEGYSDEDIQKLLSNNLQIAVNKYDDAMTSSQLWSVPMAAACAGNSHIIKPSTRYKGGFDVMFSGIPGDRYGGTTTVYSEFSGTMNLLPDLDAPVDELANASNGGVKATACAMAMAEAVAEWVVGSALKSSADSRTVMLRNLADDKWDAKALLTRIDAIMTKAGFGKFGNVPTALLPTAKPIWAQALGDFVSFVVVKEPNHQLLNIRQRSQSKELSATAINTHDKLQAEFGFAIALTLNAEVCQYITQTKKGQKIPMTTLNTWVNAWARALLKMRGARKAKGETKVNAARAPRYIIPPSRLPEVSARRKELGLFSDTGRMNEDGIFISNNGRLNYCPSAADTVMENARTYEDLQEQALMLSYNAGAPLITTRQGFASSYFAQIDPEYRENLKDIKSKIARFAGSLQTYSWDYNTVLTSSLTNPDKLISQPLAGSTKPDDLAIDDYMKTPAHAGFLQLFPGMQDDESRTTYDTKTGLREVTALIKSNVVVSSLKAYAYLLSIGKAPDTATLLQRAIKALDYKTLDPSSMSDESPERYDADLYTLQGRNSHVATLSTNMTLLPTYVFPKINTGFVLEATPESKAEAAAIEAACMNQVKAIGFMLNCAMADAAGGSRSNLMRIVVKDSIPIEEDDHYYDLNVHTVGEFAKVYNYLGGRVFYEMLQVLNKAGPKELSVVNPSSAMSIPPFDTVVRNIKPLSIILGKYSPDREAIADRAEEMREALKPDTSITVDDFGLPGSKKSFQVFPHQLGTMQVLGSKTPPRFALLDIAPGGGKTLLGLIDIGNLKRQGKITRPCVLAPNGLVRNWIEDMHMVCEGKWNLIPITTATFKTWGEERLTNVINNAPINTIFVIGLSFLRLNPYQLVIGNHVERVSAALEFCKKFGFDYIIFDESHKGKNEYSQTHRAIKQLTTSSAIKFVREATGTFIQTKLTDVVGQTALMTSNVFRTIEEYVAENSIPAGEGRAMVFAADTPYRARQRLGEHVAVISYKKKEWAFMLPRPIEHFSAVPLDDAEAGELGQAHQMLYQAVLKETLDELKADPTVMRLLAGKGEDADDAESDADADEDMGTANEAAADSRASGTNTLLAGMTTGIDNIDDSTMEELEAALKPYLQRLEMMLTDPLGDKAAGEFFQAAGAQSYVSMKVKKIIERIKLNFAENPWKKGTSYKLKALVYYNGQQYVLMGVKGEKLTVESYHNDLYTSNTPPDKDDRWKPEARGKVIVFCRYTRSVGAIYKALPPGLKKLAVQFSDAVKDKWGNLEAFRTTPYSTSRGVQILIANEQAISEGHNLQMASRIVRVESPWSPGELDQSSSRIFRPDPTGKNSRENIYLDWILCNNTLEVAKMGRLISRMIDKTKFDEANNPLYDSLGALELPPISMSLETIAASPRLKDIEEYTDAYRNLVYIQSSEFEEMRQTRPNVMFSVPQTQMMKGSAIIDHVPYLAGLKSVPDRHNLGLTKLTTFLQNDTEETKEVLEDPQKLVGMYAHTEFGNGVIVGIRQARGGDTVKITSVRVQLASGDIYTGDPAMIYLAANVNKENVGDFSPKTKIAAKSDKKAAAAAEKKREAERIKEEKRLAKSAATVKKNATREKKLREAAKAAAKADTAKDKLKRNKMKKELEVEEEEADPLTLDLYPVVYNGFLAVEATPGEDDAKDMKSLGFRDYGAYAYAQVKDKKSFDALLKWMDSKYYLKSQSRNRLAKLADSFMSGSGRKFAIEQAPIAELKLFYTISHKLAQKNKETGKQELKVYPVIINGKLFINIDLSTNPLFRRQLNKVIPGTVGLKFEEADGLWIQFFNTRNEVVAWTKKTLRDGATITNLADFKANVDELGPKLKMMQKLAK